MGNFLIRTVKVRKDATYYHGYSYNAYAFDYLGQGRFKDIFYNEYIVDIGEDTAPVFQYLVNHIVMAERQLHINAHHVYVAIFDLAHYTNLSNDSGAFIMYPIGSNGGVPNSTMPSATIKWGKVYHYNPDGSYTFETLLQNPPNLNFEMRPTWDVYQDFRLDARALTVTRNAIEGGYQKSVYFNCVTREDCDITKKGTIALTGAGDLLATRFARFKYYWRFVEPFIASHGIDEDGFLTYKPYALPGILADYVSDLNAQKHRYLSKSLYARNTHLTVVKMMVECRHIIEINRFDAEQGNYDTLELMRNEHMNAMYQFVVKNHLARLIGWFPYLLNGIEIEEEIVKLADRRTEKRLIPQFNYHTLKDIFDKMLQFYRYFRYFYENWFRATYYMMNGGEWPTYLPIPNTHIGDTWHAKPRLNTPQHIKDRCTYYQEHFWKYHNYFITYQALVAKLERLWDVRSWTASQNVKHQRGRTVREPDGDKWRSTRDGVESGVSYPKAGRNGGLTPRQERNRYRAQGNMEPGPSTPESDLVIYWGALEFSNIPISPIVYPAAPPPPPPPRPPKRRIKWDNTIHPLTAEEEDEEAIALLEQIEENERVVLHTVWSIAKEVIEFRGKNIPWGVDVAVHVGIDLIVDEINPTDRKKVQLADIDIKINDKGKVPETFDGPSDFGGGDSGGGGGTGEW